MGLLGQTFRRAEFRAATPENPRFSLNDPAAWDAFGVTRSTAGIAMNAEIAFTYSPWWRGISLVSNDCAKLPLHVYKRVGQDDPDGIGRGKQRAVNHPAYLMLRRKPNERMTAYTWKRLMISHAMSKGNGYSVIQRQGDGTARELLPLDPDMTFPVLENGRLLYITDVNGEKRKILAENMFHLHGMGYDGLQGYSVWQKAKDSLGLGVGAKRFATTVLKNSGRPATILTHPLKLAEKAKDALLSGWERMHAGIDNAGRTAILDAGLDAKAMQINPEDMQLISTMEFSVRDIANFLGLAPHKLGDTSRTAYNSLEQENQSYLDDGLDPWLVNFEDQCHDKLLTEQEKEDDSMVVEFLRLALLRADMTARSNYYRTALGGAPWMSRNEVRDREGMNPTDGGDDIKDPLNMGDAGGKDNAPKTPKAPVKQAFVPEKLYPATELAILDVVGRMVRRLGSQAKRASAKGGNAFLAWLEDMPGAEGSLVTSACSPVKAMLTALFDGGHLQACLDDWLIESCRQGWSKVADSASAKALMEAVAKEEQRQLTELSEDAVKIFLRKGADA